MKTTAWALFRQYFKDGEEVILIDYMDRFYWGKLKSCDEEGCTLQYVGRLGAGRRRFDWIDVRFMSHDGFPCRKLFGADGSERIESEPTARDAIREGLLLELNLVQGDPFLIEGVRGTLYNRGNDGLEHYMSDTEECLALDAKDGAGALLWDLSTVFFAWGPGL